MCYSAMIWADYRKFVKAFGATLSVHEFVDLVWRRTTDAKARMPKAMEAALGSVEGEAGDAMREAIGAFHAKEASRLEQELFAQRKRLADAQRTLQTKTTKKALDDRRIATGKIDAALGRLSDLRRSELVDDDARIFPGTYAPVMVMEAGRLVVKPMRYQCRPAGKPALVDAKFPGTYNARRDNLEGGYWRDLFGRSHGVMVVGAFYENVKRHGMEHRALREGEREENVVLEFRPRPAHDMLIACLWSRWTAPGEPDLLSFAAITDDPPAEVAAAGHDRCIVSIKPENLAAWLTPDPRDLAAQYAILDDPERRVYEHRLAA